MSGELGWARGPTPARSGAPISMNSYFATAKPDGGGASAAPAMTPSVPLAKYSMRLACKSSSNIRIENSRTKSNCSFGARMNSSARLILKPPTREHTNSGFSECHVNDGVHEMSEGVSQAISMVYALPKREVLSRSPGDASPRKKACIVNSICYLEHEKARSSMGAGESLQCTLMPSVGVISMSRS